MLPLRLLETPRRKLHLLRLLLKLLGGQRPSRLAKEHDARENDDDRQQRISQGHVLVDAQFIHHDPLEDQGPGEEQQKADYKTNQASHHPEITPLNVTSAAAAAVRGPRSPAPLALAP